MRPTKTLPLLILLAAFGSAQAANCPAALPKTPPHGPDDVTCTCTPALAKGGQVIGGGGNFAAGSSICRAAVYQGDLTEDGGEITYRADKSVGSSLRAGPAKHGVTPISGPADSAGLWIYRLP